MVRETFHRHRALLLHDKLRSLCINTSLTHRIIQEEMHAVARCCLTHSFDLAQFPKSNTRARNWTCGTDLHCELQGSATARLVPQGIPPSNGDIRGGGRGLPGLSKNIEAASFCRRQPANHVFRKFMNGSDVGTQATSLAGAFLSGHLARPQKSLSRDSLAYA